MSKIENISIPNYLIARFVSMYPKGLPKTILNVGDENEELLKQFAAHGFSTTSTSDGDTFGLITTRQTSDLISATPQFLDTIIKRLVPSGVFVIVMSSSENDLQQQVTTRKKALQEIRTRFRIYHRQKTTFGYLVVCQLRKTPKVQS